MPDDMTIHLWDASRPADEEQTFPVTIYSQAIPRVGDQVSYWVDWPMHMPEAISPEPGEPCKVSGVVDRVLFQYRYMRGWGNGSKFVVYVSVYLRDYRADLFPHGASKGSDK